MTETPPVEMVSIDKLSLFLGGCSALGVALCSGSLYETIPDFFGCGVVPIDLDPPPPPDNNNLPVPGPADPEPEMMSTATKLKNLGLTLTRAGFVVLRSVEKLLMGAAVYTVTNNALKDRNFPVIASAFISGGFVGVIQAGAKSKEAQAIKDDWKKLLTFGGGAAVFSGGMETLILILQSGGHLFLEGRPTHTFPSKRPYPDPSFVEDAGSWAFFFETLLYFMGDPFTRLDQLPNHVPLSTVFGWDSFLNAFVVWMVAEERSLLFLLWGSTAQNLLKKVGIQHRVVTNVAVGGALAAYWSSYGKRVNEGLILMGGITLYSVLSEVLGHHSEAISGLMVVGIGYSLLRYGKI